MAKKDRFEGLKKIAFILIVIGVVVLIAYFGKYLYNKYLEYNNGKDEINIYKIDVFYDINVP